MNKPSVFETKPVSIKVDAELLKRIDEVSRLIGEPRSTVMRMAMRLGLRVLTQLPEVSEAVAKTTVEKPLKKKSA